MSDYPLCEKYKAPPSEKGAIPHVKLREWVETLPKDWPEKFWDCMGQVTCTGDGIYTCDVEDTLWSLERGIEYRRWNG